MGNSSDPRSDQDLLRAVRRGEERALEVLYQRHRDWVLRLARRFTGHDADALDVMQETFVYLARRAPTLELSATLTTFLYPAVRHLSLSARRKRLRSLAIGDIDLDLPAEDDGPGDGDDVRDLLDAMRLLSHEHRRVLLMRYVDELTIPEIAKIEQIPEGTIKSRLHHATAAIRSSPALRRWLE